MVAERTTVDEQPAAAGGLTPDVIPTGGGYRAIARKDGEVVWTCPHVHFTEHSAKNCPSLKSVVPG